jgi:hypothetical protein
MADNIYYITNKNIFNSGYLECQRTKFVDLLIILSLWSPIPLNFLSAEPYFCILEGGLYWAFQCAQLLTDFPFKDNTDQWMWYMLNMSFWLSKE